MDELIGSMADLVALKEAKCFGMLYLKSDLMSQANSFFEFCNNKPECSIGITKLKFQIVDCKANKSNAQNFFGKMFIPLAILHVLKA